MKITEVKLILEVDLSNNEKGAEYLFPSLKGYLQEVAGIEHYKGEVRTSRAKLPEMNVVVTYNGTELFSEKNAPIKGQPQVKINKDGDAVLVIRPLVKLTSAELGSIGEHIDSDVRVTMEPCTVDIEAVIETDHKKPTAIRRRSKAEKTELSIA